MRFRKGSIVEVLNKKDLPSGSWKQAEIIFGNGHTYNVRYVHTCVPEERVPRSNIRPCPPPIQLPRTLLSGDYVEVLMNGSWKPAEVSRVVDGRSHIYVKLREPLMELRVSLSDIRLRQVWQNGEWIVIGKDSRNGFGAISIPSKVPKLSPCPEKMKKCGYHKFLGNKGNCLKKKQCTKKIEGKPRKLTSARPSQTRGMVDRVSGVNYRTRSPELGMTWGNPNDDTIFFSVGSLESSDSESISSSVGSCSPSYSKYRAHNADLHLDDREAESGSQERSSEKDGFRNQIHQMELSAYRSTVVALYASGPLSWEREDMLTNLRMMLHITNDEHLLELQRLASMKRDSS